MLKKLYSTEAGAFACDGTFPDCPFLSHLLPEPASAPRACGHPLRPIGGSVRELPFASIEESPANTPLVEFEACRLSSRSRNEPACAIWNYAFGEQVATPIHIALRATGNWMDSSVQIAVRPPLCCAVRQNSFCRSRGNLFVLVPDWHIDLDRRVLAELPIVALDHKQAKQAANARSHDPSELARQLVNEALVPRAMRIVIGDPPQRLVVAVADETHVEVYDADPVEYHSSRRPVLPVYREILAIRFLLSAFFPKGRFQRMPNCGYGLQQARFAAAIQQAGGGHCSPREIGAIIINAFPEYRSGGRKQIHRRIYRRRPPRSSRVAA